MSLRDPSLLRPYQEKSLAKMFGNGRARSGIIVLPCGAGKTFVGIAAACTVGKSCMVLCPNQTSVAQWQEQFHRFTTISHKHVYLLTGKDKQQLPDLSQPVLLLTTYNMIGSGGRAAASAEILRCIREREWGVMVLDEVHTAVAATFRKALKLRAHCRLGLTATLVREDGRDKRLAVYIGPKLYEANWNDLTRAGYLANVQVCEVWCPMSREFYREYLRTDSVPKQRALAVMNPIKCAAMDYLLKVHEARNDKIIIFSESVFALRMYADKYKSLAIEGSTPQRERDAIIMAFKTPNNGVNKLFLSKVGDVALDVPDANVVIQISSHFGSRLQEAQRMGRILRRGTDGKGVSGNNAWFYTLISTDTMEVYFSNKRRRYLVDQGYAYKVLKAETLLPPSDDDARTGVERLLAQSSASRTLEEQLHVLRRVEEENVDAAEAAELELMRTFVPDDEVNRQEQTLRRATAHAPGVAVKTAISSATTALLHNARATTRTLGGVGATALPAARRVATSMAALSGATGVKYMEFASAVSGSEALKAAEDLEAAERRALAAAQAASRIIPKAAHPSTA